MTTPFVVPKTVQEIKRGVIQQQEEKKKKEEEKKTTIPSPPSPSPTPSPPSSGSGIAPPYEGKFKEEILQEKAEEAKRHLTRGWEPEYYYYESRGQRQIIDPESVYIYKGQTIKGDVLRQKLREEYATGIMQEIKGIASLPPGRYNITTSDNITTYTKILEPQRQGTIKYDPATEYLLKHASPEKSSELRQALEMPNILGGRIQTKVQSGFIEQQYKMAYNSLSVVEKEEYGFRYQPFKEQPIEEWKYYPGGIKYLESLSTEEKEELKTKFLEGHKVEHDPWYVFGSSWRIDERPVAGFRTQGLTNIEVKRKIAWEELITTPEQLNENFYNKLSPFNRMMYSYGYNLASAIVWPVVLTQTGMKYTTGEGSLIDPLARIQTGKTLFPDIGKELYERKIGGPSGIVTVGISEGIGAWTGKGSNEWKTVTKYPWETVFATGGELLGFYLGGQYATNIYQGTKELTLRGFGKTRTYLTAKTGLRIPSYEQISYYYPKRIIRRWWIKRGTKDIDEALSIPYHSPETLTPGGLSYAPGQTPMQRIEWVTRKLVDTKDMPIAEGDYLIGSSGSRTIGRRYVIRSETLHELPAFSGAPYGFTPTRFYRFGMPGGGYSTGQVSLLPHFFKPSGFAIRLRNIFKPIRGTYDDITKWALEQPKGSWGMIGPKMLKGGPEAEVNIFGKTVLKRYLPSSEPSILSKLKGYEYYTNVPLKSGLTEVAPIVFTKPIHRGFPMATAIFSDRIKKVVFGSSYSNYVTSSLINPYYSMVVASRSIISSPNIESVSSSLSSISKSVSMPSTSSISKSISSSQISTYSPSSISGSMASRSTSISKSVSKPSSISSVSSPIPPSSSIISRPSSLKYYFKFIPSIPKPRYQEYLQPSRSIKGDNDQAYNVYVRERHIVKGMDVGEGKFIKANKKIYNRSDALAYGSYIVDNSAAASFKIRKAVGKPQPIEHAIGSWNSMQHKFYMKGDIIIESTDYRIDTSGELEGITAKGIIASMNREVKRERIVRRSKRKLKTKGMQPYNYDKIVQDMTWGIKNLNKNNIAAGKITALMLFFLTLLTCGIFYMAMNQGFIEDLISKYWLTGTNTSPYMNLMQTGWHVVPIVIAVIATIALIFAGISYRNSRRVVE